jgi:hypothetical protein
MRFRATVEPEGKTATGIGVPADVVEALGSGKRPKVAVTINGFTYRTTVFPMGGRYLIPLSAENRSGAGVSAGDDVEVELVLDTAPREVVVPADFQAALRASKPASTHFETLSFTHRKEWVRWIEEAKQADTRTRRIDKAVVELAAGKKTH